MGEVVGEIVSFEVVLKICERCNIDCDYCYMFHKDNQDYKQRPVYINEKTIDDVANWLLEAVDDFKIKSTRIIFHGGEPTMMKLDRFDKMCSAISNKLKEKTNLSFSLQTNGTLLTNDWVKSFVRNKISVGISLDGPKEINDKHRLDHQGESSYDRTVEGIRLLQRAASHDLLSSPGVLIVPLASESGRKVYRHFVDELKVKWLGLMIPMDTHDDVSETEVEGIKEYFLDFLDEWKKDNDPHVTVRLFNSFVNFLNASATADALLCVDSPNTVIIAVSNTGDLCVNDDLKTINFGQNVGHVNKTTLREYLNHPVHNYLNEIANTVPSDCLECSWVGYCRGGVQHQVFNNRYSAERGFNNKSVYCDMLKAVYSSVATYLLDHGLDEERALNNLYEASQGIKTGTLAPFPASRFNGQPTTKIITFKR